VVTTIGTSCRLWLRFCAVTTISSTVVGAPPASEACAPGGVRGPLLGEAALCVAATEVDSGADAAWVLGSAPGDAPGPEELWANEAEAPARSAEARTIGDAVARAIVSKRIFLPSCSAIQVA
jgi:hypothetical protein